MSTYHFDLLKMGTIAFSSETEKEIEDYHLPRIIQNIDNLKNECVIDCFSWYWIQCDKGRNKFIYAFQVLPFWFLDFVDEFNNTFKNIQLKVYHTKNLYMPIDAPRDERIVSTEIPEGKESNIMTAAFRIIFSDSYPELAKKHAEYVVHHIVRQASLREYAWNSARYLFDVKPPYLKAILFRSNNEGYKYRAITEQRITMQHLLNLDDLSRAQAVEKLISNLDNLNCDFSPKQTEIIGFFTKHQTLHPNRNYYPGKYVSLKYPSEYGICRNNKFTILYNGAFRITRMKEGYIEEYIEGYLWIYNGNDKFFIDLNAIRPYEESK